MENKKKATDQQLIKELRKKNEYLGFAIQGMGVGIWDWNVKTGQVDFNERWAEIIGHKLKNLKPSIKTWEKFSHPDDLKCSERALEKHFSGETDQYVCETRMKHKKGHWVWVLDQGKVFEWDKKGKPIRVVGTHLDITARKEEEEELKKLSEVTIGRELRMIELKKEINALLKELGRSEKYKVGF